VDEDEHEERQVAATTLRRGSPLEGRCQISLGQPVHHEGVFGQRAASGKHLHPKLH